jgi:hypothetical protein
VGQGLIVAVRATWQLRGVVAEWRRAGGPCLGHLGRETEVAHDALRHGRLVEERDQAKPPTAARVRQHVEANARRTRSAHRAPDPWSDGASADTGLVDDTPA